jgi:hypothetical protein
MRTAVWQGSTRTWLPLESQILTGDENYETFKWQFPEMEKVRAQDEIELLIRVEDRENLGQEFRVLVDAVALLKQPPARKSRSELAADSHAAAMAAAGGNGPVYIRVHKPKEGGSAHEEKIKRLRAEYADSNDLEKRAEAAAALKLEREAERAAKERQKKKKGKKKRK